MAIVPQVSEEVKIEFIVNECATEGCHEDVFRDGLCWYCFIEEEAQDWDAYNDERQTCWAGMGYV